MRKTYFIFHCFHLPSVFVYVCRGPILPPAAAAAAAVVVVAQPGFDILFYQLDFFCFALAVWPTFATYFFFPSAGLRA